jgi:hypothetical protein
MEKPRLAPEQPTEEPKHRQPEHEPSDEEQQIAHENLCRERFIQDWVLNSALTPKQKVFVSSYLERTPGPWREYNGTDFKVIEQNVVGNAWNVSFGVYIDDYEAQRIDSNIPLSG